MLAGQRSVPTARLHTNQRAVNRTIEAYNFKCVQVLSDVISAAAEVAELYNFYEEQSLHGNSVEAGKFEPFSKLYKLTRIFNF